MSRSKQAGMTMKAFIVFFLGLALGLVDVAEAQPKKVPRIGYVSSGDPSTESRLAAFRRGLRELGYIEGKNIQLEYRYVEGKVNQAQSLITELVQLKVDVLVVGISTSDSCSQGGDQNDSHCHSDFRGSSRGRDSR